MGYIITGTGSYIPKKTKKIKILSIVRFTMKMDLESILQIPKQLVNLSQ